jgi:hypothetical protein
MRTTIQFDEDVSAAIEQFRRDRGLGASQAVNELIRRGLLSPGERRRFVQRTRRLGLHIDVSNVAEAVDLLEGPTAR